MMFVSRKETSPVTSPKGRILCTEDDPDTRDLIALVLSQHGFDVMCTANADEAINLAKTRDFDLYLLDNWMPALSGPDLTRKLREFDVSTPILFYSGAAYEVDKEAARLSGAQGYLVKPANGDQLIAEVVRLIAASRIATPATSNALPSVGSERSTKGK
jgi:DNA-binding response OmpR family regulator